MPLRAFVRPGGRSSAPAGVRPPRLAFVRAGGPSSAPAGVRICLLDVLQVVQLPPAQDTAKTSDQSTTNGSHAHERPLVLAVHQLERSLRTAAQTPVPRSLPTSKQVHLSSYFIVLFEMASSPPSIPQSCQIVRQILLFRLLSRPSPFLWACMRVCARLTQVISCARVCAFRTANILTKIKNVSNVCRF